MFLFICYMFICKLIKKSLNILYVLLAEMMKMDITFAVGRDPASNPRYVQLSKGGATLKFNSVSTT